MYIYFIMMKPHFKASDRCVKISDWTGPRNNGISQKP